MLKKKGKIKYNLKFQAFDQKLLSYNLLTILFELKKKMNFIKVNSVITMPYSTKRVSLIRSPFVDKTSKELFELRIFKTLVTIEIFEFENFILEKFFENHLSEV